MDRRQCWEPAPHGRHMWQRLADDFETPIGDAHLCVGVPSGTRSPAESTSVVLQPMGF